MRERSSQQRLLVGAVLIGLAAVFAWRNRGRIRDTAEPWLDAAAERIWPRLPWRRAQAAGPTLH